MLDEAVPLPDDPQDLKALARLLIAEVKAQALLIETLRHQLAGYRAHRFGPSGESAEQLQLALETSEVARPRSWAGCVCPRTAPTRSRAVRGVARFPTTCRA